MNTILASGNDFTARTFNADDGKQVKIYENGHKWAVLSAVMTMDGEYVITGSSDNTIIIWKTSDATVVRKLEGHIDTVTSVAVNKNKYNREIVSGSNDRTVLTWDFDTGIIKKEF